VDLGGRARLLLAGAALTAVALSPAVAAAKSPPAQDSVAFAGGPAQVSELFKVFAIDARSGPSGENPAGLVRFDVAGGLFRIGGPVTCLAVRGISATINLHDDVGGFGIITVQVIDDQPDSFDAAPTGRTPTDCSPLAPTGAGGRPSAGDIVIVDAGLRPTTKDQCKGGAWKTLGFGNQGECIASVRRPAG
jgi:hypothetical protein